MSIILVISNLKHNGEDLKAGQIFDRPASEFPQQLINEGVLRVIDGADTIEEAEAILAEEVRNADGDTEVSKAADTWGAKPDEEAKEPVEPVEEKTAETNTASTDQNQGKAIAPGDIAPADQKKDDAANL